MKKSLFLNAMLTALWEKWAEFCFEWKKITATAVVTPLMYLIALGWGLGETTSAGGRPYIDFLVPGILALTTMNTSFSAVSLSLNVQRLYERSFDQIVISPTPMGAYITGQAFGGALRGIYGGTLILLLSIPFGASTRITPGLFFTMLLGGMVFSSLGVLAALIASTHSDVSRFSTFIIFPMTFLCNTIFPIDRMPYAVSFLIKLLPLTHMSSSIRAISCGENVSIFSYLAMLAYLLLFILLANFTAKHKRDN